LNKATKPVKVRYRVASSANSIQPRFPNLSLQKFGRISPPIPFLVVRPSTLSEQTHRDLLIQSSAHQNYSCITPSPIRPTGQYRKLHTSEVVSVDPTQNRSQSYPCTSHTSTASSKLCFWFEVNLIMYWGGGGGGGGGFFQMWVPKLLGDIFFFTY